MLDRIRDVWSDHEIGASGPEEAAKGVEAVKAAWSEAGREGEPRLMALAYFSLGERAPPATGWGGSL